MNMLITPTGHHPTVMRSSDCCSVVMTIVEYFTYCPKRANLKKNILFIFYNNIYCYGNFSHKINHIIIIILHDMIMDVCTISV